jgi:hypothetical protein
MVEAGEPRASPSKRKRSWGSIIPRMLARLSQALEWAFFILILTLLLTYSSPPLTDELENIRAYTRQIEFDYSSWTLEALGIKIQQGAAGIPNYMQRAARKVVVMDYLRVTQRAMEAEAVLNQIFSDPAVRDKESASQYVRAELDALYERQARISPLAEAVLQEQVTQVVTEGGLAFLGQSVPSVLYHSSPLPSALIVARRDRIEQIANISIETGLTVDQHAELEAQVDAGLDVSSLVVPIGGVGVYPTMVMRTTALDWLLNTIAHEWIHNYLTLRPLGILYDAAPELRTMNETTASIAGNEIGRLVMERYYPEMMAASAPRPGLIALPGDPPDPDDEQSPPFDFRAEMHTTRITVDELLAEGMIEKAESYMEARRQVFLKNGYLLRKLNQAYFSFYGSYADIPGGAAGEDPVGPAVRALRDQSDSLADFINRISWMTNFEDLQSALQGDK